MILSELLEPECKFLGKAPLTASLMLLKKKNNNSVEQPQELIANPRPLSFIFLLLGLWVVPHLVVVCMKGNNIYNSFLFGHLNLSLCWTEFDPLHSIAMACCSSTSYLQWLVSQNCKALPLVQELPRSLTLTLILFIDKYSIVNSLNWSI